MVVPLRRPRRGGGETERGRRRDGGEGDRAPNDGTDAAESPEAMAPRECNRSDTKCWRSPEKMNAGELSRTHKFTGGHWEFGAAKCGSVFSGLFTVYKENLQLKRAAILPTCTAPSPLLGHAIP
jgi:hypothetical protein